MDIHLLKDDTNSGSWVMIVSCPLPGKHELKDPVTRQGGPSFDTCAKCEHQTGKGFVILNPDGEYDGALSYPELLKCGVA